MYRSCLILLTLICVGCGSAPVAEVADSPPEQIDTDFTRLPDILSGVQKSAEIWLYEGLPGDFWEPELREQELKQKQTVRMHGYPVYEELPTVEATDAGALTELLSTPASFEPLSSGKKCGGFQLEYCIEWGTAGAFIQALVCLECGEVKIYSPKGELHCDISRVAAERLKEILSQYQVNRPAMEL